MTYIRLISGSGSWGKLGKGSPSAEPPLEEGLIGPGPGKRGWMVRLCACKSGTKPRVENHVHVGCTSASGMACPLWGARGVRKEKPGVVRCRSSGAPLRGVV